MNAIMTPIDMPLTQEEQERLSQLIAKIEVMGYAETVDFQVALGISLARKKMKDPLNIACDVRLKKILARHSVLARSCDSPDLYS